MEKKYVVPEHGRDYVAQRLEDAGIHHLSGNPMLLREVSAVACEAFARWQAEHAPQLDDEQWFAISGGRTFATRDLQAVLNAAIYRAYLAPEPEIPREVMGLFAGRPTIDKATHDRTVVEAYELGLRAGRQG